MRVFQIQDDWGMDHLQLASRRDPQPGPGQVLLRIKAASLNYRDLVVPNRGYGSFTGNTAADSDFRRCRRSRRGRCGGEPGARRQSGMHCFYQGWLAGAPDLERLTQTLGGPADGMMADLVCLPESGVVKVPAHLADEQAATLPWAALTAWSAVVTYDTLGPGSRVLVQGTGGVALFALQFAKLLGAHVTIISSSDAKLTRAQALGADAGINYLTTTEWARSARVVVGQPRLTLACGIGDCLRRI